MIFEPLFHNPFQQFVKKQHKPFKAAIEDAVEAVLANPAAGEFKKGDLQGIQVFKFKFQRVEYLIACRFPADSAISSAVAVGIEMLSADFYKIGVHENFYDELKLYVNAMKG